MAVVVKTRRGKKVTLLNPAEKGRKYAAELKSGVRATNDHVVKRDKKGNKMRLTKSQRIWRSGYLSARSDEAKAYKSNCKKKKY